jgi:hypothetical protein
MAARSLNANLLTQTSHLLTQTNRLLTRTNHLLTRTNHLLTQTNHLLTQTNHLLTRTTRQTILTETAEAAEAEAAAEIRQGRQENHHANQHKYPFKGSQDRRDVFKTEQLLRILPPMDSQ